MGIFSEFHLILLGIVALLLFGNRLPSVMRSLGSGISEFKKGMHDLQNQVNKGIEQGEKESHPADAQSEHSQTAEHNAQPPSSPEPAQTAEHHAQPSTSPEHAQTAEHAPQPHASEKVG